MMLSEREVERMFVRFTDKSYGKPATLLRKWQWHSLHRLCEKAPPGDFVECGVMRGGAAMLMARYDRELWLFDSWEGIPDEANTKYGRRTEDMGNPGGCRASMHECIANFVQHCIPTEKCHFIKGWIKDTAQEYDGDGIAILRLDMDIYSSTREAIEVLYPKVVDGGYVIIDDYCFPKVREAVHEHLTVHGEQKDIYDAEDEFIERAGTEITETRWIQNANSPITGAWFQK